ncbi:hypothetical protein [Prescottella defluvii]|uniref:hypothetical protein n=1 Tax=Prescottella defluvii TaxID=1323361 RepID=UPI0004F2BBBB|nr:hypothetical protein [Prescottella defluvii]
MRIRHVIALVPAALLLLTGCSDSEDTAASAPNSSSVQAATTQDDAALDAAVKEMCGQVAAFLDNTATQAEQAGESFDRAAQGQVFLDQMKANSAVWVASYNMQAEAAGEPPLDPSTATWEDMPEQSRALIENSVDGAVAGTC